MKFERGMDSEVVKFKILSDDWRKLVLLQNDRHVEFQTQDGLYYRLEILKLHSLLLILLCYNVRFLQLTVAVHLQKNELLFKKLFH